MRPSVAEAEMAWPMIAVLTRGPTASLAVTSAASPAAGLPETLAPRLNPRLSVTKTVWPMVAVPTQSPTVSPILGLTLLLTLGISFLSLAAPDRQLTAHPTAVSTAYDCLLQLQHCDCSLLCSLPLC